MSKYAERLLLLQNDIVGGHLRIDVRAACVKGWNQTFLICVVESGLGAFVYKETSSLPMINDQKPHGG